MSLFQDLTICVQLCLSLLAHHIQFVYFPAKQEGHRCFLLARGHTQLQLLVWLLPTMIAVHADCKGTSPDPIRDLEPRLRPPTVASQAPPQVEQATLLRLGPHELPIATSSATHIKIGTMATKMTATSCLKTTRTSSDCRVLPICGGRVGGNSQRP